MARTPGTDRMAEGCRTAIENVTAMLYEQRDQVNTALAMLLHLRGQLEAGRAPEALPVAAYRRAGRDLPPAA